MTYETACKEVYQQMAQTVEVYTDFKDTLAVCQAAGRKFMARGDSRGRALFELKGKVDDYLSDCVFAQCNPFEPDEFMPCSDWEVGQRFTRWVHYLGKSQIQWYEVVDVKEETVHAKSDKGRVFIISRMDLALDGTVKRV